MLRADDDAFAVKRRGDAVRDDVLDRRMALAVLQAALRGGAHHRAGYRMGKMLLQAG